MPSNTAMLGLLAVQRSGATSALDLHAPKWRVDTGRNRCGSRRVSLGRSRCRNGRASYGRSCQGRSCYWTSRRGGYGCWRGSRSPLGRPPASDSCGSGLLEPFRQLFPGGFADFDLVNDLASAGVLRQSCGYALPLRHVGLSFKVRDTGPDADPELVLRNLRFGELGADGCFYGCVAGEGGLRRNRRFGRSRLGESDSTEQKDGDAHS